MYLKKFLKTETVVTTIQEVITKEDRAKNIEITFGKYKGKTLGDVFNENKEYITYLINNSKDNKLVNACNYLIKLGGVA